MKIEFPAAINPQKKKTAIKVNSAPLFVFVSDIRSILISNVKESWHRNAI